MKKLLTIFLSLTISVMAFPVTEQSKLAHEIASKLKFKEHFNIIGNVENDTSSMYLLVCPPSCIGNISSVANASHNVMECYEYEHLFDNVSYNNRSIDSRWVVCENDGDYLVIQKYESAYNILILSVIKR